jgi:hypothetical protein
MRITPLVIIATLASTTACSPVFYWDVPVKASLPDRQADVPADVPPNVMCALVRRGALDRKDLDTGLGIFLGIVGGAATGAGTAVAAQTGHSPTYVGEWASVAGLGVVTTAAAIYFLVKAGNDRQEYWLANAAVAKINADYAQYPVMMTDELRAAFDAWKAAPAANKAQKLKQFEAKVADQRAFQATVAGHEEAVDRAQEYKNLAARQTAEASALGAFATLKDTGVTVALATYQAALAAFQKTDPASKDFAQARQALTDSSGALDAARHIADTAHQTANDKAVEAARTNAIAADAMNAMSGLQAGWTDCSTALQAIGTSDAAASAAFAGGLGAGKSGGSGSSGSGAGH